MENRKELIVAGALGVVLLLILAYEFFPTSSTDASAGSATAPPPLSVVLGSKKTANSRTLGSKKQKVPQNLDPTLRLQELAVIEQIKYEGSGRNIFVSEAEPIIPTPVAPGQLGPGGRNEETHIYTPPAQAAPGPIPLKFFGFANQPGEPRRIFLSKGEDVFIAGEGEIIDRRYKVVRIAPTSVEIQDVVGSGPPQNLPLTQG
ncbi:MAG TPA: hypothetical protein VGG14_05200 [Candidatus Sulfotelmatobacter sp.]|jgi:hypothetical protein